MINKEHRLIMMDLPDRTDGESAVVCAAMFDSENMMPETGDVVAFAGAGSMAGTPFGRWRVMRGSTISSRSRANMIHQYPHLVYSKRT